MILKPPPTSPVRVMGLTSTQIVKSICLFHIWFSTTCQAFHQRAPPSLRIASSFGSYLGPVILGKRGHRHWLYLPAVSATTEIFDVDFGDDFESMTSATSNPWETQFQNLKRFRQEYGHVNFPQHPPEEIRTMYPKLASFCKNQRSIYKNNGTATTPLSPILQNRKELLESLGFDFDVRQSLWDSKYEELYAFWKEYGHLKVTRLEHPDLYSWMYYQRQRYNSSDKYKPLTDEQIKRLESINFCWNPKEEEWWINYYALKNHKEKHGNLTVSDSKLRTWKNSLRRACREYVLAIALDGTTEDVHVSGLNERRLEALRELEFCWLPEHPGVLKEAPPRDIFDGYQ